MFHKLLQTPIPIKNKLFSKRLFSSCNNRCKADELTSQLLRQEQYLEVINDKINHVFIISYVNLSISFIMLIF